MRMIREFVTENQFPTISSSDGVVEELCNELDRSGIVLLPRLISDKQLTSMQLAFEARLQRLRWNNFEGYEKTEPYRHMIEDVLLLDQARFPSDTPPSGLTGAVAGGIVGHAKAVATRPAC